MTNRINFGDEIAKRLEKNLSKRLALRRAYLEETFYYMEDTDARDELIAPILAQLEKDVLARMPAFSAFAHALYPAALKDWFDRNGPQPIETKRFFKHLINAAEDAWWRMQQDTGATP